VVVVVNPISGSARRGRAVDRFAAALRSADVAVEVRPTERAGHGRELATAAAGEGADAVVAAGGDGTVNEVATGLLRSGDTATPLALLPLGTANLLARDLGVPFDPEGAARTLLEGEAAPIDTAEAAGRTFVCCLGVGIDAHVVQALHDARRGHIRMASYVRPVLRAFRTYAFPTFRVTTGEGETHEAVLALFLNTPTYAGFFRPVPDARPDDGLLDALLLLRGGRSRLPRWAWAARRGTLPARRDARVVRSASFRVEAGTALPWQVDGEVGGATPVDILIRPSALRVVRPRPPAGGP
jgi:YegS/Rv2252/BmrU family lipid kinase